MYVFKTFISNVPPVLTDCKHLEGISEVLPCQHTIGLSFQVHMISIFVYKYSLILTYFIKLHAILSNIQKVN